MRYSAAISRRTLSPFSSMSCVISAPLSASVTLMESRLSITWSVPEPEAPPPETDILSVPALAGAAYSPPLTLPRPARTLRLSGRGTVRRAESVAAKLMSTVEPARAKAPSSSRCSRSALPEGAESVTKRMYEQTERGLPSEGTLTVVKPSEPGRRRLIMEEPPPSRLTTSTQPRPSRSSTSSSSVAPALCAPRPSSTWYTTLPSRFMPRAVRGLASATVLFQRSRS